MPGITKTDSKDCNPEVLAALVYASEPENVARHIQHCSAEINTAIREGFYVHMLPPMIAPVQDADGEIVDIGFQLCYEIEKIDPKRTLTVDHRDELSKKRSPDYQPVI